MFEQKLDLVRLHAPSAGGMGLTPGQRTKILRATWWGLKKVYQKMYNPDYILFTRVKYKITQKVWN